MTGWQRTKRWQLGVRKMDVQGGNSWKDNGRVREKRIEMKEWKAGAWSTKRICRGWGSMRHMGGGPNDIK